MTVLERLKELEAKATKGPWAVGFEHETMATAVVDRRVLGNDHPALVDLACGAELVLPSHAQGIYSRQQWAQLKENLALAVAVRNALPHLIAVAEAAQKSVAGHVFVEDGKPACDLCLALAALTKEVADGPN